MNLMRDCLTVTCQWATCVLYQDSRVTRAVEKPLWIHTNPWRFRRRLFDRGEWFCCLIRIPRVGKCWENSIRKLHLSLCEKNLPTCSTSRGSNLPSKRSQTMPQAGLGCWIVGMPQVGKIMAQVLSQKGRVLQHDFENGLSSITILLQVQAVCRKNDMAVALKNSCQDHWKYITPMNMGGIPSPKHDSYFLFVFDMVVSWSKGTPQLLIFKLPRFKVKKK